MSKPKEIFVWLAASLLAFIILAMMTMALLSALFDREMVQDAIEEKFARSVGGEIKYLRLELAYFPRPHVVMHKAELFIPDSITIKIQRMKAPPARSVRLK